MPFTMGFLAGCFQVIAKAIKLVQFLQFIFNDLRRNPQDVGVTSGQKSCTKMIYIVLQTSVGLF